MSVTIEGMAKICAFFCNENRKAPCPYVKLVGGNCPFPRKDELIGKIGLIEEDHGANGYLVRFPDPAWTWHFPYFCLEKVKESECEFKPFDRVLVRDNVTQTWACGFFSHYCADKNIYKYYTGCGVYEYCIPYEGNEHLVNTTEDTKG